MFWREKSAREEIGSVCRYLKKVNYVVKREALRKVVRMYGLCGKVFNVIKITYVLAYIGVGKGVSESLEQIGVCMRLFSFKCLYG